MHKKDTDCEVDQFGTCIVCQVYHGAPCPVCDQQAFHAPGCTYIECNIDDLDEIDTTYLALFGGLPHLEV